VFASASNDAGHKPRTYPGRYSSALCVHSADDGGNASAFNPSPVARENNFTFLADCVQSCWPVKRDDHGGEPGQRYLSGISIAIPVAVCVAVFMINYLEKEIPRSAWNIEPWSPEGIRKIFERKSHRRDQSYDMVSLELFFKNTKTARKKRGRV
jgi:hypothetical protein